MDLILPGYRTAPPDDDPAPEDSTALGILLMAIIVSVVVLAILVAVGLTYGAYVLWVAG